MPSGERFLFVLFSRRSRLDFFSCGWRVKGLLPVIQKQFRTRGVLLSIRGWGRLRGNLQGRKGLLPSLVNKNVLGVGVFDFQELPYIS